ncbi:Palmitoyltransferase [Dispira simplex]|nr:Palmitoyltransferase [Dispira simplex]
MEWGVVFVVGVSLLISFIGLTTQYFIFWEYLGGFNIECLTILGGFNVLLALLCYNYYLACVTDPGRVPLGWKPSDDPHDCPVIEIKKNNAGPRYCRTCNGFKPPRSHHCSSCKRCVLKMDHHCPWINNCVGYGNYGHFVRFILYVDMACAYCLLLMFRRVWFVYINLDDYNVYYAIVPKPTELLFLILNLIVDTMVLLLVFSLTVYHVWIMVENTTTIESMEIERLKKLARRRVVSETDIPYNLGFKANICAVLGPNPWLWLWPQAMPAEGGVVFPIAPHLQPPVYWPPLESISFETPTVFDQPVRQGRRHVDPESYHLPTITSRIREQMVQNGNTLRLNNGYEHSDVETDDYSIDTYDSDDIYDEEDDLAVLQRKVERATTRQPLLTDPVPLGPTTLEHRDSGVDSPNPFTKGSLLDRLAQKEKQS